MERFANQARDKLQLLDGLMEEMTKEGTNLAMKLGEDPESFKWEEFFQLLLNFNESFDKAIKDNDAARQEEIKRLLKGKKGASGDKKKNSLSRKASMSGGITDMLEEQKDITVIERRKSIRRAKSIRRVVNSEDTKKNLNNLLDMLEKMK